MNKKQAKMGIISFAHVHAYNYAHQAKKLANTTLAGLYDEVEHRGKKASRYFDTKYFSNLDELLQETDEVVVTSENSRHLNHIEKAAENENNVLCEKPISTDLESSDRISDICENKDLEIYTSFPVRYCPSVNSLKKYIEEGRIGDLIGISSTNRGTLHGLPEWFYDKDLAGGGAVMDHTVHLVDLFRWVFGEEIKEVYAEVGALMSDIDVEDCGLISLKFESGSFATIDCSWSRPKSFPRGVDLWMRIYGTDGVIELDAFKQKFVTYSDKKDSATYEYWGPETDLEILKDLSKITLGKEASGSLATVEDGKKALEVALAAYKSKEKGRPVKT